MIIGTLLIPGVIWQYHILKEKGLVLIKNPSFGIDEPFGVEEFFAREVPFSYRKNVYYVK